MDGEVTIEGFNDGNVRNCSVQYLDNEEEATKMITQAKEIEIYELLKVPIVLLMICVIYFEHKCLPTTMTRIYKKIFKMIVNRTALKALKSGLYDEVQKHLDVLLSDLGRIIVECSSERCSTAAVKKGRNNINSLRNYQQYYCSYLTRFLGCE